MIVVAVRCYNEEKNLPRFFKGYDFADKIIISDGGSTDKSLDIIAEYQSNWTYPVLNIDLLHFDQYEITNETRWNPDNPHINFVLNAAKAQCKNSDDWIIFDDMDDVPNYKLREDARNILETTEKDQINAYRLYMWGTDQFFPQMNNYFENDDHKSLWAWKPSKMNVYADEKLRHGTILGMTNNFYGLPLPYCLLHKSWMPDTIDAKVDRYNKLELPMNHPADGVTFGKPEPLPEYAHE
jgi:glycosyltransferase involved in cell wall biosynthesis